MIASLLNHWRPLDQAEEPASDTMRVRRVVDIPLAAFRSEAGQIAGLDYRFPHRFALLAEGSRAGEAFARQYQRLVFDPGGLCVHNPNSAAQMMEAPVSWRTACPAWACRVR